MYIELTLSGALLFSCKVISQMYRPLRRGRCSEPYLGSHTDSQNCSLDGPQPRTHLAPLVSFIFICLFVCLFIYLFIYLERMTNINVWLPFTCPLLGTWPTTRAHALTGNRTGDTFGLQSVLNPLACTSQGSSSPLNRLGDKTMSETQNSTQSPQNHLGFM